MVAIGDVKILDIYENLFPTNDKYCNIQEKIIFRLYAIYCANIHLPSSIHLVYLVIRSNGPVGRF
jgi:hypothetical protein